MKKEERLLKWIVYTQDKETGENWIEGVYEPYPYVDLGTIKMLRNNVKRQVTEIKNGTHEHGYLNLHGVAKKGNPEEVLVMQDGAYIWSEKEENYRQVFIGMIYEKNWHDSTLMDEYRDRVDYFAIIVYK